MLLSHIGYAVPNMDVAVNRWLKAGATTKIEPTIDPIQKVNCSLLTMQGEIPIELIAPADENQPNESPIYNRLKKGGGLDHICLFCDDINEAITEYELCGGILISGPCYGCVFDRNIAFLIMRTGLTIELMEKNSLRIAEKDPLNFMVEKTT